MPSLDLTRVVEIAHAGRRVAEVAHMGRVVWRRPGSTWLPERLFGDGERGGLWLPARPGTLFSSDGVEAISGQGVWRVNDLSGNGNHLLSDPVNDRPLMSVQDGVAALNFDGSNDKLIASAFALESREFSMIAANTQTNTGIRMLAETSPSSDSSTQSLFLTAEANASVSRYRVRAKPGSVGAEVYSSGTSGSHGRGRSVVAAVSSAETGDLRIRDSRVGSWVTGATPTDPAGKFGKNNLYIGMRGTGGLQFGGILHGLLIISRALSEDEIDMMTNYLDQTT